jgi:hypothetical protein
MGRTLAHFPIRCHELEPGLEVDGVIGLDIIRHGALLVDLPKGRVRFEWA